MQHACKRAGDWLLLLHAPRIRLIVRAASFMNPSVSRMLDCSPPLLTTALPPAAAGAGATAAAGCSCSHRCSISLTPSCRAWKGTRSSADRTSRARESEGGWWEGEAAMVTTPPPEQHVVARTHHGNPIG